MKAYFIFIFIFYIFSNTAFSQKTIGYKWIKKPYLEIKQTDEFGNTSPEGYTPIRKNKKWGLMDMNGNLVVDYLGDKSFQMPGLIPVVKSNKLGFINSKKQLVTPYEFDTDFWLSIYPSHYEVKKGSEQILLHSTGKKVATTHKIRYLREHKFSDGLMPIEGWIDKGDWQDSKAGYIDKNGSAVMDFIYENVQPFNGGIAAVQIPGKDRSKFVFIDKKGKIVFNCPNQWENPTSFDGDLAFTHISGKNGWAFFNRNFKIVVPLTQFGAYAGQLYGYYRVTNGKKMAIFDKNGKFLIDYIYDNVYPVSSEIAIVKKTLIDNSTSYRELNGLYSIKDQKIVLDLKYKYLWATGTGIYVTEKNNKYGFIDKTGKLVIPYIFNEIKSIVNKMLWVRVRNKWGIIQLN